MRFLANENFPGDAVTQLKAAGHDIVWVRVAAPGIKDEDVLALARGKFCSHASTTCPCLGRCEGRRGGSEAPP